MKEIQPIGNGSWQPAQIQPDIKGTIGDIVWGDLEADLLETTEYKVPFREKVFLKSLHFFPHTIGFKHRDCSFLEGYIGAAIKVGATASNGFDELLWTNNPSDTPARKTKALC